MENAKEIAKERIETLFEEAEKSFKIHPERSNRYVELARKIGMKLKVKIPKELKRKFCKHCNSYLKPGVNLKIRNHKGRMIYECLKCGKFMRFVIKNNNK